MMRETSSIGKRSFCAKWFFSSRPDHELHRDKRGIAVLAEIIDGDDVRMIEPPRGFGFALKARDHFGRAVAFELVAADRFQRDRALDARVESLVNDPHRAAAELAQDFVFTQLPWGFAHGVLGGVTIEAGADYLYLLSISHTVF